MKEKSPLGILIGMQVLGALPLALVPVALIMSLISGPIFFFGTLAYPLVCGILWWRSWAGFRAGRPVLAVILSAPPALVSAAGIGLYVYSMARAMHEGPSRSQVAERLAEGDLRSIMSAEARYKSANRGSFGELDCLAAPATCIGGYAGPAFIDKDLAARERTGYRRAFHPGTVSDVSPRSFASYAYTAVPLSASGQRGFCGDDTGRMCVTLDGSEPPVVSGRCAEPCQRIDARPTSPAPMATLSPGAALRNEARALFDAAHPEQALEKYREAIRLQPEASDYADVGRCLDKLGKRKEAREAYQKALELAPGNAEIEYALAQSLLQGGRPAEAIDHFKKITALEPTNPGAFIDVGLALQGAGRQEEALKQFREAARLPPTGLDPKGLAYYDVGVALENLNRPKEALEAYRKAVELSPDFADAQDSLANALLMESRFDEALGHFKKVAALEPGKARGFTGIGMASSGAGHCPEAIAAFARSLQLCKTCLEANELATYEICKEKERR